MTAHDIFQYVSSWLPFLLISIVLLFLFRRGGMKARAPSGRTLLDARRERSAQPSKTSLAGEHPR